MRLLYVASGHPLQEADDCLMWAKLGIEWFSTGYYSNCNQPGDLPCIDKYKIMHPSITALFSKQRNSFHDCDRPDTILGRKNQIFAGSTAPNQWHFSKNFINHFDVVIFNHFVKNVECNWNVLKHKKVILKTYSMHDINDEMSIHHLRRQGMISVRNSPKEHLRCHPLTGPRNRRHQRYAGHDMIIRGSVVRDEHEMSGWTGQIKQVVTFCNNLRDHTPNKPAIKRYKWYQDIIRHAQCNAKLYGVGNGKNSYLPHQQKVECLRNSRASLIVGTPGSNNTYSMVEAWIMGTPIVAFGPKLWQSKSTEVHELIENGVTGFWHDNPNVLAKYLQDLMNDHELARQISKAGREKAISVYGREVLSQRWIELFKNMEVM